MPHKPVLLKEVLQYLKVRPGLTFVDGTIGSGGHAREILKAIGSEGKLIGLDQDPASVERCRRLFEKNANVSLHHKNFADLGELLNTLNISSVDAVLLDVGFSSDQIENAKRGFSFERSGPLDMRMNPESAITAADLVNKLSERELKDLFWKYGNERRAGRFAEAICQARLHHFLETTDDLVQTIENTFSYKKGKRTPFRRARLHPATRVFQALRIAVNDELNILQQSLPRIWKRIAKGGRLGVISFHSLEDRIIKNQFRSWSQSKEGVLVNKKPLTASLEERQDNPRSRSAKLRVIEKIL